MSVVILPIPTAAALMRKQPPAALFQHRRLRHLRDNNIRGSNATPLPTASTKEQQPRHQQSNNGRSSNATLLAIASMQYRRPWLEYNSNSHGIYEKTSACGSITTLWATAPRKQNKRGPDVMLLVVAPIIYKTTVTKASKRQQRPRIK